jgi:hypothetical protein
MALAAPVARASPCFARVSGAGPSAGSSLAGSVVHEEAELRRRVFHGGPAGMM